MEKIDHLEKSYWSRGKLKIINDCPVCKNNINNIDFLARQDNEATMPDLWKMKKCRNCKSIWLSSRPDEKSLSLAYQDYYTHKAESNDTPKNASSSLALRMINGYINCRFGMHRKPTLNFGSIFFSLIEPWRLKLDYYGRHLTKSLIDKPGELLDIGCGNGAFLARAADMGWKVHGCEIDPKAVLTCRSIGLDVIQGDALHPSLDHRSFDVISISHVLEHVENQIELLQRAHELLRPGGWIWLALPNPQSIGLHVFGSSWNALHPPYHLIIPSQSILINWMETSGFSKMKFLRRGAHIRAGWKLSTAIAQRENITLPSKIKLFVFGIISDGISTIYSKKAEETVIMAQKPE